MSERQDVSRRGSINVASVSKEYSARAGSVLALHDISFEAAPSEFVSVVGPSGCGKSTLLMMLAGLDDPTSGAVSIDNKPVTGVTDNVGVVFQQDLLLDWRDATMNVMLQVQMRHLPMSEYRQRAQDLLNLVGIGEFAGHHPRQLSGGMRQRVAICRALIHRPQILLMDEPFGALDAITREQLNLDLSRLCSEERTTTVFVTHDVAEAAFLGDKVLVMTARPGRIASVVDVPLPRPRVVAMRSASEFTAALRTIRDVMAHNGVLAE